MPAKISECIKQISIKISKSFGGEEGVNVITPYKGSPRGVRQIIVYAHTLEEIVLKIKAIYECYKIFDLKPIAILDKDPTITQQLKLEAF